MDPGNDRIAVGTLGNYESNPSSLSSGDPSPEEKRYGTTLH